MLKMRLYGEIDEELKCILRGQDSVSGLEVTRVLCFSQLMVGEVSAFVDSCPWLQMMAYVMQGMGRWAEHGRNSRSYSLMGNMCSCVRVCVFARVAESRKYPTRPVIEYHLRTNSHGN